MTPQQIFDTVATHLSNQGEQSLNEGGDCRYRGPRGLKCAVGQLIPDDMYSIAMEHRTVIALVVEFTMPDFFTDNQQLLNNLQIIHDCREVEEWKEGLENLCSELNLSPTVLDTLEFKPKVGE